MEDTSQLKSWLIKNLEPISEADPLLLSDYVLALIKQESTSEPLNQKLDAFLGQETSAFVTKLIRFMDNNPMPSTSAPSASDSRGMKRSFDPSQDPSSYPPNSKLPRSAFPEGPSSRPPTGPAAMRGPGGGVGGGGGGAPMGNPLGPVPRTWGAPREPLQKVAQLCKDYHYKGFCARGDSCQYLHDDAASSQANFPTLPSSSSHAPATIPYQPSSVPSASTSRDLGPRGSRHPNSNPAQDSRQSPDTLVVEKIPRESLSIDSVRNYFSQFGKITNITIDPRAYRAVVSFATPEQSRVALLSPEAIFGNRFVRIFRQRLDLPNGGSLQNDNYDQHPPFPSSLPPHVPAPRPLPPPAAFVPVPVVPRPIVSQSASSISFVAPPAPKPSIPQPPSAASLALQARLDALQANTVRTKELLDKLESPELDAAQKKEILREVRALAKEASDMSVESKPFSFGSATAEESKPDSNLESQAQLAQLRKEAAALGINLATPSYSDRGRGRGAVRGRGRGGRGGPAGPVAPRNFRLDNRTTTISTESFSDSSLVPKLLSYLQQFGQVTQSTQDSKLVFKFETRLAAELALSRGSTIPDVGVVTFQWHHYSAPTSTPFPQEFGAKTEESPSADLDFSGERNDEGSFNFRMEEQPRMRIEVDDEDELERSWNR